MIGAIHHAALRVRDVDEARERWQRLLGLSGERRGENAVLRCAYEDFCLILQPSDEKPGLDYVGYELKHTVSLDEAAGRLQAQGVPFTRVPLPDRGEGLRLNDPDGNGVVIVPYRRRQSDRYPNEVQFSETIPHFHPRKFGHVNYVTGDAPRIVDWYVNVLGFKLTDWIGDEGAWLHVNGDHHVLAVVDKGYSHIHHLAFELVDWGELRVALDHLAQHGRNVVWGPGRHGMARNLFSYWRMPEEDLFVEWFADLEQIPEDHQPRTYPDTPHSSNTWGILPPRSYFRFDEEAIRGEKEQVAAYFEPVQSTVM